MNHDAELAERVLDRTLDRALWTHEAHVRFGLEMVRRHDAVAALGVAREAIRAYNEASGVANTDSSGYHETLTAYYCAAVAHLDARGHGIERVLTDPLVRRDAPLDYWDRGVLFGEDARRVWVPPARPLPFVVRDGTPTPPTPTVPIAQAAKVAAVVA